MPQASERMQELVRLITQASHAYYVDDAPIMTDREWDLLYSELQALEEQTGMRLPDSPTTRVGGEPLTIFRQHRHLNRLWSLDKVQSEEGLQQWFARVRALHQKTPDLAPLQFSVEYKYDGLTLNLTYEDGLLIQAATRGNGMVGEEVLPQARAIMGIPLSIPYQGLMEIHGECLMRLSVLSQYNRTAAEPLKNARNAAAGALRNLDPQVTASRRLDARFYEVGTITNPPYTDQPGLNRFIKENGFPTSPLLYVGEEEGVLRAIREVEAQREQLDFLIDGAVIKVCDLQTRKVMGHTDKFPRWAVAFKFEAEEATATLEAVTWEPGRTGKLTPLGHVSPVDFAGVTVKKATLNNIGDIRRKDLSLGATVFIRRSNDVIPEILGRVKDGIQGEAILAPSNCPACGSELVEIGAHLFCLNKQGCKPQVIARLTHFCSREAMNIEQLSEKTLEVLYDHLGVRKPQDLYRLEIAQVIGLPGFQEKRAENLMEALKVSKDCQLDAFLLALGIPNIGRATARDLAMHFGSLDQVKKATLLELMAVPAIGEVVGQSVVDFFFEEDNQRMVDELQQMGVSPRPAVKQPSGGVLLGRSVVLTGTLPTLTRSQAEELITNNGGQVSSSVSRRTSYLLLGENPGSKHQKALALGIPILSEADLLAMLGQEEANTD